MKLLSGYRDIPKQIFLGIMAIIGISFWFFLGFPFANHNESYHFVVQLEHMELIEVLSKSVPPVSNFRPLGSATAWLTYRLSGNTLYPQQLLNYLFTILAWLLLFCAIKERKFFSWIAFTVGVAFFSGYLFLFHIHGVFYGPLLIYLAFLLATAISDANNNKRRLLIVTVLGILTSFFHPFALLIFIAFIIGRAIERKYYLSPKQLVISTMLLTAAFVFLMLLAPNRDLTMSMDTIHGWYTSYKLVEVHPILSFVSWLLSAVTVISINTSRKIKVALVCLITTMAVVFVLLSWPVLLIWIAVCLLKAFLMNRWAIIFIIGVTASLPAIRGTGSPTYAIFVLMACSTVVPLGWPKLEKDLNAQLGIQFSLATTVILVLVLLKLGVRLPVVGGFAQPLLAEKEKTFQMENIINWMISSDYSEFRLVLCHSADDPVISTNVIDRKHRAPTSQFWLDQYMDFRGLSRNEKGKDQLLVCFGGEEIDNAQAVYRIPGNYNGNAIVYKGFPE